MRKSPTKNSKKDTSISTNVPTSSNPSAHHGSSTPRSSYLFALPAESLLHITSFLEPPSLSALGRTNKALHEHIEDDNTWRRAFAHQYLGIGPENDLHSTRTLLFRKVESTWKKEFISRYSCRRMWTRSRTSAVTHIPHHATVSDIHMLSSDALLSSSILYGIVARSFPLKGKVVKGFLNASGMRHGFGNPNAEFIPDVTTCIVSSEGSSARLLWGHRDGKVSVMVHPHTMAGSRAAAKMSTSTVEDAHMGAVNDAAFLPDDLGCVTVSMDGCAKIWSLRRFGCVWTSPREPDIEAFTKVLEDITRGVLVCATNKGDLVVFSGLDRTILFTPGGNNLIATQLRIRPPTSTQIEQLFIDKQSLDDLSLLVRHKDSVAFYRYDIDTAMGTFSRRSFGDPSSGFTRIVLPSFRTGLQESAFVLAGDRSGGLAVYDWNKSTAGSSDELVLPDRRADVFPNDVTTLAANPFVIAAGSILGNIRVLDALSLKALRTFTVPTDALVSKIILRNDMIVAAAGIRVLAWHGGLGASNSKGSLKSKGKSRLDHFERKWQKQYEFQRDIAESRDEVDIETENLRAQRGREREQTNQLTSLGLSEREAVEYVLMLSRDEAVESRCGADPVQTDAEDGIFELDDEFGERRPPSSPSSSSSGAISRSSSLQSATSSPSLVPVRSNNRPAAVIPSGSNVKVQVSPRVEPEPTEAGGLLSSSPFSLDTSAPITMRNPTPGDFPEITPSDKSDMSSPSNRHTVGSATRQKAGIGSPPKKNAWNTPFRTPPSSPPKQSKSSNQSQTAQIQTHASTSTSTAIQESVDEWAQEAARISTVEDEELRYALELSLAEARSRQVE